MTVYLTQQQAAQHKRWSAAWVDFGREWFDIHVPAKHHDFMKSIFPFFWGDGYADPPEVYGRKLGLNVAESRTLADRYFLGMQHAWIVSDQARAAGYPGAPDRP
ncbi:MAG TPA: hypothetical protein VKU91_03035 [Acidimicrobiales bacterium]|nr:hypothetical protein [Acidimicrobiales bacterium]